MRRLLVVAVLGATVLAGCSSSDRGGDAASPSTGAPSATGVAPSGGAAVDGAAGSAPASGATTVDQEQLCAAAREASAQGVTNFIIQIGKLAQASAAEDSKAVDSARQGARKALADWAAALRQTAGKSADQRLRGVLGEMAREVADLPVDVDKVDDRKLDGLQKRLEDICGG